MSKIQKGDLVVCVHPGVYGKLSYCTGLEKGKAYCVRTTFLTSSGWEIGVEDRKALGTFKIGRFIKVNI